MASECVDSFGLTWAVTAVNRQTREIFERKLTLDMSAVSPKDLAAIEKIVDQRDRQEMVKYRRYWKEQDQPKEQSGPRIRSGGFCVLDYYEDEAGNPLTNLQYMQALMGQEDIIVFGNPNSVLRLGPADIARPEKWTVEKANTVAHFLEVVNCLAVSDWVRTETSYTSTVDAAGNRQILDFQRPNVLVMNSVLVFIRQLMAEGDRLFQLATDAYLCHVGDEAKKCYVTERRHRFNDLLNKPTHDIPEKNGRELLALFFYGFGMVHRNNPQTATEFRRITQQHGKEKATLAIQGTLQHLYAHAHNVAHVIAQDFSHWLAKGCAGPDRVGIHDLLGDISEG